MSSIGGTANPTWQSLLPLPLLSSGWADTWLSTAFCIHRQRCCCCGGCWSRPGCGTSVSWPRWDPEQTSRSGHASRLIAAARDARISKIAAYSLSPQFPELICGLFDSGKYFPSTVSHLSEARSLSLLQQPWAANVQQKGRSSAWLDAPNFWPVQASAWIIRDTETNWENNQQDSGFHKQNECARYGTSTSQKG